MVGRRGRALRRCAAGQARPPAGRRAADGARPRGRSGRGAAALRAVPGDAHDHRGRAATGSRSSACATRPGYRSTCTPRPASSTTAGPASGPTTSTAARGPATARSPAPSSTSAATWTSPRPEDSFPRVLLRTLVAEHLGCDADDVPEDPHELFDAMVACADALDEWYAGGVPDKQSGIRGCWLGPGAAPHRSCPHVGGRARPRSREGAASGWPPGAEAHVAARGRSARRPPGRLRRLEPPELTDAQLRLGAAAVRPAVRPRRPAATREPGN